MLAVGGRAHTDAVSSDAGASDGGERLAGGNVGGAVRVGDTVRRVAGAWTPAVHALLGHLADKGFRSAPRPLGFDEDGREVLTFLEGEAVGGRMPWPPWTHADDTLEQVAEWMRGYHRAVADFVPPAGAIWSGTVGEFLDVVGARAADHAAGIRAMAAAGDEAFGKLVEQGMPDVFELAVAELGEFRR